MNKSVLVIGIICLLIGASVVSSTNNVVEDVSANIITIESTESYEEIFSRIWYFTLGTGFYAWGPGNITRFRSWDGEFFDGGTWTNDGRWLLCMYENGTLYEIDPKTFDACAIGEGGIRLNTLAYDPVTERMYGTHVPSGLTDVMYEVDPDTGKQTELFTLDYSGGFMVGMGFDAEGVLYGWDVVRNSLWIIDIEAETVEEVGTLSISFNYAEDGDVDKLSEWIYLTACVGGCSLYRVNKTTGDCELCGSFDFCPNTLAISYELNMMPPVTNISFEPVKTNCINDFYFGDVIVYLNATDNTGVIDTFYRINGEEWITYESPFVISDDGEYIIEYYSYDYVGNIEEVNICIYPENNPPNIPIIKGPCCGKPGVEYTYCINASDPDNDTLFVLWNWGDGDTSGWIGPFESGTEVCDSHVWNETGTFNISATVRDEHGASVTAYKEVIMPRDKATRKVLLMRLLERFPVLERFLNTIRGWI